MSRHRKIAIVGGIVVAALAAGAWRYDHAQGATGQSPQRPPVAVLDFGRVLREAKHHKDALAALNTETAKMNERLNRERQKLRAQRAAARRLPADSPERLKQEAALDKIEAALGATIGLETKTVRKREAELYYQTYLAALAEVEAYAKVSGIEVVLRASSDTVDSGKLTSVLGHFNRSVVWSAAEADITSIIIERMNQRSVARKQPPQGQGRAA